MQMVVVFCLLMNFLVLLLQERPDFTAVGAAFGVAQTSPFSTGEEHEITTLLPRNDQHHRLDG